jgi:lysophospholipase L1-like esterase
MIHSAKFGGINRPRRRPRFVTSGSSTLPETLEYITRLVAAGDSLTSEQTTALNTCIDTLKTGGVWDLLDEVYCFGGSTLAGQKVKLKYASGNADTLTTFNMTNADASMTGGFGPGATNANKYATTGYIPASYSRTYTDFSYGVSMLGQPSAGGGNGNFINDTPVSTIFKLTLNPNYGGLWPTIANTCVPGQINGFHSYSLTSSGQRRGIDDAIVDLSTHAQTPTFPTQISLWRSAFNSSTDFATGKMGFAFVGAGLTDAQQRTLGGAVRALEYAWGRRSAPNGRIVFMGDSITQGSNASPVYTARFGSLVAASASLLEINLGVQGGKLMGTAGSSLKNRYGDALLATPQKVVIMIGTNDAASVYSSQFRTDYDTVLSGLISGGMSAADIVVCSLPFCTNTGARPQANQQLYADAASAAAAAVGAVYVDIFALTLATPSYISADTIHPTTAGHAAIATAISAAL